MRTGLSLGALNAPVRKPIKRYESAMLAAVRAAGGAAWYVPDDFLVLGPNLMENGDFSQGSAGWNPVAATFSVSNGEATLTATSTASPQIYKSFQAIVGKSYLLSFEAKNISATYVRLHAGGTLSSSTSTSWTEMKGVLTATAAVSNLVCLLSASAAGQQGAFRNVKVQEILSMKDFQDNAGTLAACLSSPAGLIYDQAGLTGTDLIANPDTSGSWTAEGTTPPTAVNGVDSYLGKACRSVTFPAVASGGYTVCRARDAENIFNVVAGVTYFVSFEYALSRDLTAGESIAIAVTGSSGLYAKSVSAGAPGGVWSSGSGGQPAVASGGGTGLRPYATTLNAPLTVYIRKVSVKVAGGVVATQATAGNKPTITRIPRKLGPELVVNGDFSNGTVGWTTVGAVSDASDGACTVTVSTTSGRVERGLVLEAGKTYVASANVSAASTIKSYLQVLRNAAGSYASIKYSSTVEAGQAMLNSAVFTAPATDALVQVANNSGTTSGSFKVDNISVREVLEWSYALTFDGSNDSLAAPASIIGATLTQPYTMIAWGRTSKSDGTAQRIVGDTARWLAINSVGGLSVTNQSAATVSSTGTVAVGALFVAEVVWDGSVMKIWKDGALETTSPCGAPTGVTPSATNIGINGTLSNYFKGDLGGCVVCPAVMTDAQRLAVRKFAAAQMGLTL